MSASSSSVPKRLPVLLLTGFLGSGKTSLLLRWLREVPSTGLRMGVVMNEFGLESVDSQLIASPGLPLESVSGGCICCADESDIGNAILRLVRSEKVDYLVVETSGLADPDSVIDVLTDADLLPSVFLQAVVTVADGPWLVSADTRKEERILARRQIEFAHILCLSKCDLLTDGQKLEAEAHLRVWNARAPIVRLPFGLPGVVEILDAPPGELALAPSASSDSVSQPHLHASYRSVTWRFPRPVDRSRFEQFLSQIDPRVITRAKGFVQFSQSPDRIHVFHSVRGGHFIEEFPARPLPEPVGVLIGPDLNAEVWLSRIRALTSTMTLAAKA